MNHKFFDITKEKQDRIINAALKVFALNGYKHASTDDIVREASISKGLLFHYFGSKLGLYEFLYDYGTKFMLLELSGEVRQSETNYFVVMRGVEAARMTVLKKYPYLRRFLDTAEEEDCEEAVQVICDPREIYREKLRSIFAQADYHVFEPQADPDKMHKSIEFTLKGLTEEYSRKAGYTPEELYQEILEYLKMYEKMFLG